MENHLKEEILANEVGVAEKIGTEQQVDRWLNLLSSVGTLIRCGEEAGMKSIVKHAKVLNLFVFLNVVLVIWAAILFSSNGILAIEVIYLLMVLVIGLASCYLALQGGFTAHAHGSYVAVLPIFQYDY